MNSEFVEKLIQAKHLECEAILSILPISQQEHIQVIEKELTAMAREFAVQGFNFAAQTGFAAWKTWNSSKQEADESVMSTGSKQAEGNRRENEPDIKKRKKIIIE